MLHVALWEPEIPPNTGNVARLCAATGTRLHLVGRLGFRTDDKTLKRAGLDYWPHVDVVTHPTMDEFLEAISPLTPAPLPPEGANATLLPGSRLQPEGLSPPAQASGLGSPCANASTLKGSLPPLERPFQGRGFFPDDLPGRSPGLEEAALRAEDENPAAETEERHTPAPYERGMRLWLIDNPAPMNYTRAAFADGDVLLFGSESKGLTESVRERFADRLLGIPMPTGKVRSLNLATAVGVVLYEALRQVEDW